MQNLSDILAVKASEAKARFEASIQQQKYELTNARNKVINTLLGIEDCSRNSYGLREQFTYVSKIQETLDCMLTFYRDLYGMEYQDPEPKLETVAL